MNRGKENVKNVKKVFMTYKISFSTNIHGHHIYKSVWKLENGKKIDCHEGNHDEASMNDNHAIGVYKQEK